MTNPNFGIIYATEHTRKVSMSHAQFARIPYRVFNNNTNMNNNKHSNVKADLSRWLSQKLTDHRSPYMILIGRV